MIRISSILGQAGGQEVKKVGCSLDRQTGIGQEFHCGGAMVESMYDTLAYDMVNGWRRVEASRM